MLALKKRVFVLAVLAMSAMVMLSGCQPYDPCFAFPGLC